ncbi:MAG TPA: helix-turn-helix domain-containing protein, partial [Pirellulales bacterium]|nr:helix-turn-helix domain-containing protein [Pirellulales bacterium]
NLERQIAEGSFRADLYHRLKVVTVELPRLVERGQDIPLLIEHFVRQFAKRHEKVIKSVSTAARRRLMGYDWPGNVRELRNSIESMVVVDADGVLDVDDLPRELAGAAEGVAPSSSNHLAGLIGKPLTEVEKAFIVATLDSTGGNREEAAAMLGIGQRTLYRKIREYGL